MQLTISIKLETIEEQDPKKLFGLQSAYERACNDIVPIVIENRCWNRVALHNLAYTKIRKSSPLGSQMVCNAIFSVCKAYQARSPQRDEPVPQIVFRKNRSVHFDKRTYTLRGDVLSLYTLEGRIKVRMRIGEFQRAYLEKGMPKEAELVCRKGRWYFNLVLDLPDVPVNGSQKIFAIDLGENNTAVTSSKKFFGGGKVRHERDKFLAKRRVLQSNGSQSAKQLLKKISGKEARRMTCVNHNLSKAIIQEAKKTGAGVIVLEDLTNIRKRIRGGSRLRTRLHRWPFRQLQMFVQYKAEREGIGVSYVNPAYSSQLCSSCGSLGVRERHLFKCTCGNQQHSDWNASLNLCRFAESIGSATCAVNRTQVAAKR